jgi:hypothetical protein
MTEQQLRDVLARVVPEPPDSVADADSVVRTARRRRRARVVGVTGLAAVLVTGTLLGVRAAGDADPGLAADQPAPRISDPYATAPCPEVSEEWPSTTTADLDTLSAVRYCGRSTNGFPAADGAQDALVTGLAAFREAVVELPEADPARCAAVSVVQSDNRLLLQMGDGTSVGLPAGPCVDVEVGGRTLDASDVTLAFVDALRAQRDAHDYSPAAVPDPLDCTSLGDVTPAAPDHESLVEAVVCDGSGKPDAAPLDAESLAHLDEAWTSATTSDDAGTSACGSMRDAATTIHARTDRGDTLVLSSGSLSAGGPCDVLTFTSWLVPLPVVRPPGSWLVLLPAYVLPISFDEVTAG